MVNNLKIKYNLDNVSCLISQKKSSKQLRYQFYKINNNVDLCNELTI